jgi:hypothetical protein
MVSIALRSVSRDGQHQGVLRCFEHIYLRVTGKIFADVVDVNLADLSDR